MSILRISSLQCEYRTNPLGLDVRKPRIGWRIESDRRATVQRAYRLQAAGPEGNFEAPLWDTGEVESDRSIQAEYEGPALQPRTRYYYRVKIWDTAGRESEWSEAAWWETGLLEPGSWQAEWITPDGLDPKSERCFLLRKRFNVRQTRIASARIYATGVGLYELYLNGGKVGDELLAPGWTSYRSRLQYQTYDVTDSLLQGDNAVGFMLGDGWYRGGMGWEADKSVYGDRRAALLELHITYEDGTEQLVTTDESWTAETGPVLYSSIYHGETYDAREERAGWCEANYPDGTWKKTASIDLPFEVLIAQENSPTRATETLKPIAAIVTPAGDAVLDMGQNMVGRIRMKVNAPAGTRIVLKHAEVLDQDGNIYFANLRKAKQTVEYVAKGEKDESYAPHFTFQGFRYVKVEGYPGQENGLPLDAFEGEVIHSDMEPAGKFETSHAAINQLQRNIVWGQRGNFVDVPTDCPQRDERLGWTGDAQVFIGTALFNYGGGPFFTKWLRDLKAEQQPDGGVPYVIPNVISGTSSAAWGDAAVICPWTVYRYYGDTRLLSEQYESMKAWIDYIRAQGDNEFLWNTGFHFGDWLALDAKEGSSFGATPNDLIATAYYAYSAGLVRNAAAVLGKREDENMYGELYDRIVDAFRQEFVTPSGRIAAPTQTAHVLALHFGLVEERHRERVARDLNQMVADNDYHLTTGFVGTPYLCFALSENGYHDTAVRLLTQESYPGWLYSVSKGATTIWEHWDGLKPDGTFWRESMNSFNHYAYGAIGDWMYRVLAGLDWDGEEPAYKRIAIRPRFADGKIDCAGASYLSMYGRVRSAWRAIGDRVELEADIPANASAVILLRGAKADTVREGGKELKDISGILSVTETEEGLSVEAGSGSYRFEFVSAELGRTADSEQTASV